MRFIRTLVVSLSLAAMVSSAQAAFDKIIVFGDSLSDLGASPSAVLSAFKLLGGCAPTFPCPPYFEGRISNGPVAIETFHGLAQAQLDPGILLHGFAIGGATTNGDNFAVPGGPGMFQQLHGTSAANGFNGYLTQTGGLADPNALYVVWGGANDFFRAIATNTLGLPMVGDAVGNLTGYVSSLAAAGARQFLVPNLPDLSLTPAADAVAALLGPVDGPTFLTSLSLLSDAFNTGLENAMDAVRLSNPDIALKLFPVDDLVDAVVANPAAFGFSNVTDSCLTPTSLCADPSSYLFWDAAHPTAAAHRLLGQQMFFLAVVPVPQTLALVMLGLPLLAWAVRRRPLKHG
jgi:phospholipase/lecithinase/hemolysin